jgi:hypothetical protein
VITSFRFDIVFIVLKTEKCVEKEGFFAGETAPQTSPLTTAHRTLIFHFSTLAKTIFLFSLRSTHCNKLTMPNTNIQTGQDWGTVNVGRASAGRVAVPKTAHGVTRAKAMGLVATVSFFFRFLWMPVAATQVCGDRVTSRGY